MSAPAATFEVSIWAKEERYAVGNYWWQIHDRVPFATLDEARDFVQHVGFERTGPVKILIERVLRTGEAAYFLTETGAEVMDDPSPEDADASPPGTEAT